MANFSQGDVAGLRVNRPLENEPEPTVLKKLLAEDLWEARAQRDYWKTRAQLFESEFNRMRALVRGLGHSELAEAPAFYCAIPGCRREAEVGSKVCDSEEQHPANANLLIDICFVRSCENERIHPMTPFCSDHKSTYRNYVFLAGYDHLTGAEFMVGLANGRFVHEEDEEEEEAPPRREGPPAPVPGLGLEVATHGLPPQIDASNIEPALVNGVVSDLNAPPKCVYGQCSAPRAPGHALCEAHLSPLEG